MNHSPETERILVVIDGENIVELLLKCSLSLHEMIDVCVRDFGVHPCKLVEGPALFLTVHEEEFDRRNEEGRLRHDLLSEIAVPKRYKYRKYINEVGSHAEKGYEDSRIMNYVINRLDKFDALFMFSGDSHFVEFAEQVNSVHSKAVLICGFSQNTKAWIAAKRHFFDLATFFAEEETAVEEVELVEDPVESRTIIIESGGNVIVHLRKRYWEDNPTWGKK